MHFVVASIELADFAKARDVPGERAPHRIFDGDVQASPILALAIVLRSAAGRTPRQGHVKDEESARLKCSIDAAKKPLDP